MNIESFKHNFILITQQYGLSWAEEGTNESGALLRSVVYGFADYPACFVTVQLGAESIQINFHLNEANYTVDTLKLLNDFNDNIPFVKAFITDYRDKKYLCVSAGDFFVTSEEDGAHTFLKFLSYIKSEGVEAYLRPLTIITKY